MPYLQKSEENGLVDFWVKDMSNGRHFYNEFFSHTGRVARDYNDREDIMGNFLLNMVSCVEKRYKGEVGGEDFLRWLRGCLHRKEVDFIRESMRRRNLIVYFSELKHRGISSESTDNLSPEGSAIQTETPFDKLTKREEEDMLKECILSLSPRQREALELFYWEGMDYKEISKFLKVPLDTVTNWLYTGKRKLRKSLQGFI